MIGGLDGKKLLVFLIEELEKNGWHESIIAKVIAVVGPIVLVEEEDEG